MSCPYLVSTVRKPEVILDRIAPCISIIPNSVYPWHIHRNSETQALCILTNIRKRIRVLCSHLSNLVHILIPYP